VQVSFTRIFADADGVSHFEDASVQLQHGLAAGSPTEPLYFAPFLATEGTFWVSVPSTWKDDQAHTTPQRHIVVTVRGEYQITAGDGSSRRFPPGTVLLLEDTKGSGHSTKITSSEDAIVFAIRLASL
jgi:hypothetical protein